MPLVAVAIVALSGCSAESPGTTAAPVPSVAVDLDLEGEHEREVRDIPIQGTIVERGVTIESRRVENAVKMTAHRGEVCVDGDTGQLAWPALTCKNPDCPDYASGEDPPIFIYEIPNNGVDEEGYIKVPNSVSHRRRMPKCPTCKSPKWVEPYELPETAQRRAELDAELAEVRAAHRASGGHGVPEGHRSPREIIQERSELPQLFLFSAE